MKAAVFITTLILAGNISFAQKNTPAKAPDVTGSWKETSRTTSKGATIPFIDTLHLDLTKDKKYEWLRDGGFTYRGSYTVNATQLDLGIRFFTIIKKTPDQLLLEDDSSSYEFRPYTKAPIKEDNSAAANASRGNMAVGSMGEINKSELSGSWETYKTTNKPGTIPDRIDYTRLIKRVTLSMNGKQLAGTIYPSQPGLQWNVDSFDGKIISCSSGSDKRTIEVLKCAAGELIVTEGNNTYYFKVLKK